MNPLIGKDVNFSASGVVELLKELEEIAKMSGHNVIVPPILKGETGILHGFSFLVASGEKFCGVDIYKNVSGVDVLKSRIKQLDTEASVCLISTTHPTEETRLLCSEYDMKLFTRSDVQGRIETGAVGLQVMDELWRKSDEAVSGQDRFPVSMSGSPFRNTRPETGQARFSVLVT
ncbi:MAG: hypothetical protein HYY68_01420 [Thaumarchaeota archaeon]|nr:hypothetical protein [Nitrososphaerota archaeon]